MENKIINCLLEKGVNIPHPESVFVGPEVDPGRISGEGTILYPGTRLLGKKTLILPHARIGEETPATLDNVLVGERARLKGGYFQGAVFAGKNEFGSGAHVRPGTILEEESGAAHTVGLKQTILFPFVVLGSLINFCDCLMAGGTSRKNHSEVGSSFIHFNYTPNQDKATPTLLGNVHQGVMLDQDPIFLGGQGGLVGPCRINFGCITAAGSIVRKDEEHPNHLIMGGGLKNASIPWKSGGYSQVSGIFNKNIQYIGALISLRAWYTHVRPLFVTDELTRELILGMQETLDTCIQERVKRLGQFCDNLAAAREKASSIQEKAVDTFQRAGVLFEDTRIWQNVDQRGETFITAVESALKRQECAYTTLIQGLPEKIRQLGSQWLFAMEDQIVAPLFI